MKRIITFILAVIMCIGVCEASSTNKEIKTITPTDYTQGIQEVEEAIEDCVDEVYICTDHMSDADAGNLFKYINNNLNAVYYDKPIICLAHWTAAITKWFNDDVWSLSYKSLNEYQLAGCPDFKLYCNGYTQSWETAYDSRPANVYFMTHQNDILDDSQIDTALNILNLISDKMEYDGAAKTWELAYKANDIGRYFQDKGICMCYARAFQYLCLKSGITCYEVVGVFNDVNGDYLHAWNVCYLDGKKYIIDATSYDGSNHKTTYSISKTNYLKAHEPDELYDYLF